MTGILTSIFSIGDGCLNEFYKLIVETNAYILRAVCHVDDSDTPKVVVVPLLFGLAAQKKKLIIPSFFYTTLICRPEKLKTVPDLSVSFLTTQSPSHSE